MRKIAVLAVAVLVAFVGVAMVMKLRPEAAGSVQQPGISGVEIHKKTDTKSLPVQELVDPL